VKVDAQHELGFFGDELESVEQGFEACGDGVYFQSVRARAMAGMGKVDLVEGVLNDGLRAPDARRLSLRLFLDIAKELDAHGYSSLARKIAERGVAHAHDHLEIEEASEWGKLHYAQLLLMLERLEEADRILLDLNSEIPDDDDVLGWLGIVAAERGDMDAAMSYSKILRDLNRLDLLGWDRFYRAAIAAHLGRSDESLGLLREAFSRGFKWNIDLHSCLELKPLRGHPEFETILHPEG
jgi:tetratricopeptide (TPR) repeat protein